MTKPTSRESKDLVQFKLRFREELRGQLENAAISSGSSINSEIVDRLTRSVSDDELLGTGPTRRLIIEIATQIAHVEATTGKRWHEDPSTYFAARELADDAWSRSVPKQENSEEILEAQAQLIALREQRKRLIVELRRCCVVQPARGDLPDAHGLFEVTYEPTDSFRWRDATNPEHELDDVEAALLQLELEEFQEVEQSIAALCAELEEKQGVWRAAEQKGRAVYEQLTRHDPVRFTEGRGG